MSILSVEALSKFYEIPKNFGEKITVKAVNNVSFKVNAGETLGIVGESGCGKSSLAKTLMKIESITEGTFKIAGEDVQTMSGKSFREAIQMVFQDPYNSLNPRKKAWQIIAEPLIINTDLSKNECFERAVEMMKQVGLRPELAGRYPHMFSGGQRQRIGIARALILHPKIMILDEPVSALDVSIQAQVLNILMDLQKELGLTYLFISHDLSVVQHISDKILVMYLGQVMEYGSRDAIFKSPSHPYTKALLKSAPSLSRPKDSFELPGDPPSPLNPPKGCPFVDRCDQATDKCHDSRPSLLEFDSRLVACHVVTS